MPNTRNPWSALGALCIGFLMILLDTTIVAVANPAIMAGLHTTMPSVIWVTSIYLLTYAVPLLITGRLGDRFGPKNVYLVGLALFTLASLLCGLAGSVAVLIVARAIQGLGAALVTPQTMAIITRIFPPDKRGAALGAWGGVAGVAMLLGPLLGGFLIDNWGWQWVFFVNVPIGVLGLALAAWCVPEVVTTSLKFDLIGVALTTVGMSALVFGIQEGNSYHWSGWVWALIGGGLAVLVVFVVHQGRTTSDPLVPLSLFRDRNFTLGNIAAGALSAAVTAQMVPSYFYLQEVRGLSPIRAALVFAPMALLTALGSPLVGRVAEKLPPRWLPTAGFAVFAAMTAAFIQLATPHGSLAWMAVLSAVIGIANACIWAPLTTTTLRGISAQEAGAAAGVFGNTRQIGAVLGSAAVSALVTSRMAAHGLPTASDSVSGNTGALPDMFKAPFASAMAESLYLPVAVLLVSAVATAFFTRATSPIAVPAGRTEDVPA